MIVNSQKPIEFVNTCGAILRTLELECAVLWWSRKPVARLKKVFLHGNYPAVAIHKEKIHVHRLILSWHLGRRLTRTEYVHHRNENKLDARVENLQLMAEADHQSHHNKGKVVSQETRRKLTESNKRNWSTKWKHRRIYENPEFIQSLKK